MATKKTTTKKTTKNGVTVTTTTTTTGTTRRKRKTGTEIIPGVNVSVSWKKMLGITKLKRWFTKQTGIPTTEAGMQRKIGKWITDLLTGKNKKVKSEK
ncbi:MAG: hypothetical protein IKN48_00605 [Bacteroidaceae bacterium]|nr:hypothetical protein [Bacteroidaceae bacterium]MBR3624848.1 hypothetical protein [Bacteroidaceae bacterium]